MSELTRDEFAVLCKTTTAVINTNISRGKISVLVDNKKKIDTENALNKIFKKNSLQLAKKKELEKKQETFVKAPTFKAAIESVAEDLDLSEEDIDKIFSNDDEVPEKPKRKSSRQQKSDDDDEEKVNLDLRKKIADVSAAESKAELNLLQLEKMQGSLMPVDLVEAIIRINLQHIFKTFDDDLVNIASIYCDILAAGDRTKLAELIGKIREKLSLVINRTKSTAAQEVKNAVDEYAQTRSRGERK